MEDRVGQQQVALALAVLERDEAAAVLERDEAAEAAERPIALRLHRRKTLADALVPDVAQLAQLHPDVVPGYRRASAPRAKPPPKRASPAARRASRLIGAVEPRTIEIAHRPRRGRVRARPEIVNDLLHTMGPTPAGVPV